MEYKIDATNKILGRLATEVAVLLRGKNAPSFDPAKLSGNKVVVCNTDKIKFSGKKASQKLYRHHSGYHGGLKEEKLEDLVQRDSRLVLKYAVMGMLPKNRLRAKFIKNLILNKEQ
ncbi:MAG: 50S ribosomal protein L13 [bacterium]|nr:50S ribosomal protein L13 [bacterium]